MRRASPSEHPRRYDWRDGSTPTSLARCAVCDGPLPSASGAPAALRQRAEQAITAAGCGPQRPFPEVGW